MLLALTPLKLDSEDNLYVTSNQCNHVQKFDPNGKILLRDPPFDRHWTCRYGSSPELYRGPMGVTVDHADRVYVVDGNNRLKILDSNLNRLGTISASRFRGYVPGYRGGRNLRIRAPVSATAYNDRIYVSEGAHAARRIAKFQSKNGFHLAGESSLQN